MREQWLTLVLGAAKSLHLILDLDQVERDFWSARQAYAHAQQEEVTEERPPPQFPRSILSMKSLRGELLGEAH